MMCDVCGPTCFLRLTRSGSIHLTHNVGHAGLVAHESSQMHRLGRVILGECLHLTTVAPAALSGQEAQRTVAGRRKLAVRLCRREVRILLTFCP